MQKIAFYTLGCKSNQYDTEVLKNQLTTNNLQLTTFDSLAEVYVINSCTVTSLADHKSRQAIRRAIKQNPKAKIIVTGCYAKLQSEELKKLFPEIIFAPTPLSISGRGDETTQKREPPLDFGERGIKGVRRVLKIQDGCEDFCSYCIVPYARGKIRSKPPEEVISEAKQLVKLGAKEIVLTGINLGTYQYHLSLVIGHLSLIKDLYRIRLSSLEPRYITKELIDVIAQTPKVCHHLHIPLQSGDNNILKAMNRNYTRKDYLELINYLRSKMPNCGINTDIIVGFPGEGEKEFQNTVDLINQIKFSRLHIFTYSPRKGTPAAEFPNQLNPKTKKQRNKILQELRKKYMIEFARQYLNKEVEILVESQGKGLTDNYIRIRYPGDENEVGTLKKIILNSSLISH